MNKIWKSCIAVCCAAAAALQIMPAKASALEPDAVQVLAIGDDFLVSPDGSDTAVDFVADYFGGEAVNCAELGMTAAQLAEDLQSDASLQRQVKEADVILVSVGAYDLMNALLYDNGYVDMSQYSTLLELASDSAFSQSTVTSWMTPILSQIPEVVESTNEAIESAVSELRNLNAAANIVIQTIPNPLGIETSELKEQGLSNNRCAGLEMVRSYINVCLQGGASPISIETGVNEAISALTDVSGVADYYTPYYGAAGESSLGFYLSNIADLEMTLQPVGQVMLAAAMINADEKLSDGDGGVIAAAYEATGEAETLASVRASLDSIIQTASANTLVVYEMGDVDQDGSVLLNDAFLTLMEYATCAVRKPTTFSPLQRRAADADGDHNITLNDAYLWLMYYAEHAVGNDISLEEYLGRE